MANDPAILLVHGAWHGAWCWDALRTRLEAAGREVRAIDLPTVHAEDNARRGLADDADRVAAELATMHGPVVVVAHSYGGLPATQAVAAAAGVAHLVYIAAFALDAGESLLGAVGGQEPSWWVVDGDLTTAGTPDEPAETLFFNDLEPESAAACAARLRPQATRAFRDELTAAGWRAVPSSYLITERDMAVPVTAQEALAARAGARTHRLDTGHSPFLSRPDAVAEIVLGVG